FVEARFTPALPLVQVELSGSLFQNDRAVSHLELYFCLGPEAKSRSDFLRNRNLAALANFHTFKYDSQSIPAQSIPRALIHHILQRLAAAPAPELLHETHHRIVEPGSSVIRRVRRNQNIIQPPQRA